MLNRFREFFIEFWFNSGKHYEYLITIKSKYIFFNIFSTKIPSQKNILKTWKKTKWKKEKTEKRKKENTEKKEQHKKEQKEKEEETNRWTKKKKGKQQKT